MNFNFFSVVKLHFPETHYITFLGGKSAFVKQLLHISNITRASIKHSGFRKLILLTQCYSTFKCNPFLEIRVSIFLLAFVEKCFMMTLTSF